MTQGKRRFHINWSLPFQPLSCFVTHAKASFVANHLPFYYHWTNAQSERLTSEFHLVRKQTKIPILLWTGGIFRKGKWKQNSHTCRGKSICLDIFINTCHRAFVVLPLSLAWWSALDQYQGFCYDIVDRWPEWRVGVCAARVFAHLGGPWTSYKTLYTRWGFSVVRIALRTGPCSEWQAAALHAGQFPSFPNLVPLFTPDNLQLFCLFLFSLSPFVSLSVCVSLSLSFILLSQLLLPFKTFLVANVPPWTHEKRCERIDCFRGVTRPMWENAPNPLHRAASKSCCLGL